MRDDFTQKTKETVAKRVAWRCSFPSCGIVTIGPGHRDSSHVVNLGEAAHITAAAAGGPRFDEKLTQDERRSIENAIWMCRHHAAMIDSDYLNYSSATLRQWKSIAEQETHRLLRDLKRDDRPKPTTFVSIGYNIVFEGIWKGVKNGTWIFQVKNFLIGNESDLRDFDDRSAPKERFLVVETEGDGRLIKGRLSWEVVDDTMEVSFEVESKVPRTTPYNLSDLSVDEVSGDLEFEDGDFKIAKGEACAKQIIMLTLSTDFGDMWYSPNFGSFFSVYYWAFKETPTLLNRFLKLELTRLISIPFFEAKTMDGQRAIDFMNDGNRPPLDFINRVLEVNIASSEIVRDQITINLRLEWGDGVHWQSAVGVYIKPEKELTQHRQILSALRSANFA